MPSQAIDENAIYSVEDLSRVFDIPTQTMKTFIKNGRIKGSKIGKQWYVLGKAILDLFEDDPAKVVKEEELFLHCSP